MMVTRTHSLLPHGVRRSIVLCLAMICAGPGARGPAWGQSTGVRLRDGGTSRDADVRDVSAPEPLLDLIARSEFSVCDTRGRDQGSYSTCAMFSRGCASGVSSISMSDRVSPGAVSHTCPVAQARCREIEQAIATAVRAIRALPPSEYTLTRNAGLLTAGPACDANSTREVAIVTPNLIIHACGESRAIAIVDQLLSEVERCR